MVGTVAALSSLAVPANISRVESVMLRPSLGKCSMHNNAVLNICMHVCIFAIVIVLIATGLMLV